MRLYDKIAGHLALLQEMKKAGVLDALLKDYKEEELLDLSQSVNQMDAKEEILNMEKEAVEYLIHDQEFLPYLVRLLREDICEPVRISILLADAGRNTLSKNYSADTLPLRERTYLWMSRSCGTWCLLERHVYLEPAHAHCIWEYYAVATSQKILAYAVEVTGLQNKKVMVNLYELDYRKHAEFVKKASILADRVRLVYEKGERIPDKEKRICRDDDKILGKFQYSAYVPNDSKKLEFVLCRVQNERRKMRSGRIEEHIRKLAA